MSVSQCSANCENDVSASTNETSVNGTDVVKKFEKFRTKVELIQAEYEEAKLVIDRLKGEINLFREMEKYQTLEILSLRHEIKVLEEQKKSFSVISERQSSIEKTLQKSDESIIEIKKMIQVLREHFHNRISTSTKEIELIERNKYFQSALQCKEENLKLVKIELENALKEKEELIRQHEARNTRVNEELENLKSEREQIKDYCNKTVDSYKKRIDECEKIIENMEKERRRILGDYEICATPQTKPESRSENPNQDQKLSTSPCSTVPPFSEQRKLGENISSVQNSYRDKNGRANLLGQNQILKFNYSKQTDCNISIKNSGRCSKKIPKTVSKQRPKIEFIDPCESQPKRRLYSENYHNYLN